MKKILILKHGSLGDVILSLRAFASIRNHYHYEKIYVLTEKKFINFFNRSPYIDICIKDNRKDNFFITFFRLINLSFENFDLIIDLQNSKRTSIYNFLFRIFSRSKISSSRSFAHYRYKIPKQGNETINLGLINQLKLIGINQINKLNLSWLSHKLEDRYNKPMALFIPGVSKKGKYKQWNPNNFARIANYLDKLNYTICIVGTKDDLSSVQPIIKSCKNLLNKIDTSPPEVIYSLAMNSKIIFSNDTGPGHVAALSKKTFIWIVNDNQLSKANQPPGDHVYTFQSKSINDISSEKIIEFIKKNKLC